MNNKNEIISIFLAEHPNPTSNDWRELANEFPDRLDSIASAAILYSSKEALENAEDSSWELNQKVYDNTISHALNLVSGGSSSIFQEAESRITKIKGPAVRNIAIELGIGPYPALLNGVLMGRIMAPKKILELLSKKFEAPISVIEAIAEKAFSESVVPAFKSPDAKPQISVHKSTWEQAVSELKLSGDEIERLMSYSDED